MRVASVIKEFFVSWEHQKVNSGISAAIDVRIEEGIYGGRDLPGGGWLKQFSQKREGAMRSRQRLHYEHPQYLEEHGTSWEELPEQVVQGSLSMCENIGSGVLTENAFYFFSRHEPAFPALCKLSFHCWFVVLFWLNNKFPYVNEYLSSWSY